MSAWQKTKTCFKALTAIITFFASIAGLTAFISLYLSVQQFEEQRTYDVSKEMQQNAALISSLRTEISMNITSCDQLITQKDNYLSSTTTPIGEFNCVIRREA